jgi:hypothetical protein
MSLITHTFLQLRHVCTQPAKNYHRHRMRCRKPTIQSPFVFVFYLTGIAVDSNHSHRTHIKMQTNFSSKTSHVCTHDTFRSRRQAHEKNSGILADLIVSNDLLAVDAHPCVNGIDDFPPFVGNSFDNLEKTNRAQEQKKAGTTCAAIWKNFPSKISDDSTSGIQHAVRYLGGVQGKSYCVNGVCMPGLWIKALHVLDLQDNNVSNSAMISYKSAAARRVACFLRSGGDLRRRRRAGFFFLQFLF